MLFFRDGLGFNPTVLKTVQSKEARRVSRIGNTRAPACRRTALFQCGLQSPCSRCSCKTPELPRKSTKGAKKQLHSFPFVLLRLRIKATPFPAFPLSRF